MPPALLVVVGFELGASRLAPPCSLVRIFIFEIESLSLPGLVSNSPLCLCQVAGITGMCHHTWLKYFLIVVKYT
jgi:hypothetical protein